MGRFTENKSRTLTQNEFVHRLAGSTGCQVQDAEKWVRAIKQELIACLLDGLEVKFVDLGTLGIRQRAGRVYPNNPLTGGTTTTKPMTVACFRPSQKLNQRMNGAGVRS